MKSVLLAIICLSMFVFQNCGESFGSSLSRADALSSSGVFGGGDGIGDGSGNCTTPTGATTSCPPPTPTPTATPTPGSSPTPVPTPTPTPPPAVTTTTDLPVEFYCSTSIRNGLGTSLSEVQTQTLTLTFVQNGSVVCSLNDDSIRSTLINEKKFSIPNLAARCPTLVDGQYTMYYAAAGQNSVAIQVNPGTASVWWLNGIVVNLSSVATNPTLTPVVSPLCAPDWGETGICNWFYGVYQAGQVLWSSNTSGSSDTNYGNGQCDASASPLIVSLGDGVKANLVLTPPLGGIDFDI